MITSTCGFRENLTEARGHEQDFARRVHDLTEEKDALDRCMNHAQVEMQETEAAKEKWRNRAEFLEVEVHKLKAALSEAERQLKSVRNDLRNVRTTEQPLMTRDAELEVLQRHVEALTIKLDRKSREIVGLKHENAHLLVDVKASKKRLDVLEHEKEVTRVVESGWQGPSMPKAEQTESLSKLRCHLRQNAEAMMEASKNLALSITETPVEVHSPCRSRIGKLESELMETRGQLRECDLRLKLASAELSNRTR
ncbi:hypothetical protein BSKO_09896 [Bryopsis sp. KO-2023]|nr:hypothetical protein BSKO_09896 [Bryopsis sp. KO-2023]